MAARDGGRQRAGSAPSGLPRRGTSGWPWFSEGGVEIYGYAVGVTQLCVSLSPERVPGVFLAVVAGAGQLGVDRVDFGRALTLEGQVELVAWLTDPIGTELPDLVFGVQHQPKPVREG